MQNDSINTIFNTYYLYAVMNMYMLIIMDLQ